MSQAMSTTLRDYAAEPTGYTTYTRAAPTGGPEWLYTMMRLGSTMVPLAMLYCSARRVTTTARIRLAKGLYMREKGCATCMAGSAPGRTQQRSWYRG